MLIYVVSDCSNPAHMLEPIIFYSYPEAHAYRRTIPEPLREKYHVFEADITLNALPIRTG